MPDAKDLLDQQFLEMRWRTLSLAADFDRIGRGGAEILKNDPARFEAAKSIRIADVRSRRPRRETTNDFQRYDPAAQVIYLFLVKCEFKRSK